MCGQMEHTVYIGVIHGDKVESKVLVSAMNESEALDKISEKYKDSMGVRVHRKHITILQFSDVYGR